MPFLALALSLAIKPGLTTSQSEHISFTDNKMGLPPGFVTIKPLDTENAMHFVPFGRAQRR